MYAEGSSTTAQRGVVSTYQNGQLLEMTVQGSGQTVWRALTENTKGMLAGFRQGTNLQTSLLYDGIGYPQQNQVSRTGSGAATLMILGYTFNAPRGIPTARSNSAFSWSETFGYDNLDRLTVFNDNNGNHSQQCAGTVEGNAQYRTYCIKPLFPASRLPG